MRFGLMVLLALLVGAGPDSQPASVQVSRREKYMPFKVPRNAIPQYAVPYPGFAVVQCFMARDPAQCSVWFVDRDYYLLTRPGEVEKSGTEVPGERHGGELLPPPFQDWRLIGGVTTQFDPLDRSDHPRVTVRNEATGEVLQLYVFRYFSDIRNGVDVGPAPPPVQFRKPNPTTRPTTRPQ